ncbi:hypothetical protein L1887_08857 [Cichorium endivia]|nr:hypothetical protein L1887_08857 [Cichorium endivia]
MEGVAKAESQVRNIMKMSDNVEVTQKSKKLVKKDASKKKETKVHDPEVLLKINSSLEQRMYTLKKMNQNLVNENNVLEAKVAELKLTISESNRKIEIMRKAIEGSRKQVHATDEENLKLQQELSSKNFDLIHRLRELELDQLGLAGKLIEALEKALDEEEARNHKLLEKVSLGQAEIAKQDEQITELNIEIQTLKLKLGHGSVLLDDVKKKHDDLLSYTIELSKKHEALISSTSENSVTRNKGG